MSHLPREQFPSRSFSLISQSFSTASVFISSCHGLSSPCLIHRNRPPGLAKPPSGSIQPCVARSLSETSDPSLPSWATGGFVKLCCCAWKGDGNKWELGQIELHYSPAIPREAVMFGGKTSSISPCYCIPESPKCRRKNRVT